MIMDEVDLVDPEYILNKECSTKSFLGNLFAITSVGQDPCKSCPLICNINSSRYLPQDKAWDKIIKEVTNA